MKRDNAMKRQRPVNCDKETVRPCGFRKDRFSRPLLTTGVSAVLTLLIGALAISVSAAFSVPTSSNSFGVPRRFSTTTTTRLQSTRAMDPAESFVVQAVQPKRFTSVQERREAQAAMDQSRRAAAPRRNSLVDAQMLELLSEQFLYPTSKPKKRVKRRERPRGRPESVPGAMSYETALRKRQKEEQDVLSTVIPYSTGVEPSASPTFDPRETGVVTKRKNHGIRGSTNPDTATEQSTKKRKKVAKNLPQPKSVEEVTEKPMMARKRKGRTERSERSVDLQKYFRTELLTAKEEYSLGMQVHFMMKCEEVHEGLAKKLMRLPTMKEWAHACGFTDPDPTFVQVEGDEQIRPAGSETLFQEQDPGLFVGNGLAIEAGPGRGRGRVKKPPPAKLEPYYDDSERKFAQGPRLPGESPKGELVNTGTVTKFVETMFTGREAKQRMVQSNMRLVVSIARKYCNVGVNLQDLVQEGSLGLSRAAEKFEPKKGFKFSTYASWWIQQAVFRAIAYHSRTIRLPVHVHNLLNRIHRVRTNLERDLGRTPTNEEMARQLEMPIEKYNKMIRLTRRAISLDLPKYQQNPKDYGHESEDALGDMVVGTSSVLDENEPEKRVDRSLFRDDLRQMLQILEEDERRVICARYGLADGLTRTVTVVAAQMRQSKSWVRSQECRALRKLRRPWYEQRLKEHQDALVN